MNVGLLCVGRAFEIRGQFSERFTIKQLPGTRYSIYGNIFLGRFTLESVLQYRARKTLDKFLGGFTLGTDNRYIVCTRENLGQKFQKAHSHQLFPTTPNKTRAGILDLGYFYPLPGKEGLPMADLELVPTDDLVSELQKRFTSLVVAGEMRGAEGTKDLFCHWRSGGPTAAIRLSERVRAQFCHDAVEWED